MEERAGNQGNNIESNKKKVTCGIKTDCFGRFAHLSAGAPRLRIEQAEGEEVSLLGEIDMTYRPETGIGYVETPPWLIDHRGSRHGPAFGDTETWNPYFPRQSERPITFFYEGTERLGDGLPRGLRANTGVVNDTLSSTTGISHFASRHPPSILEMEFSNYMLDNGICWEVAPDEHFSYIASYIGGAMYAKQKVMGLLPLVYNKDYLVEKINSVYEKFYHFVELMGELGYQKRTVIFAIRGCRVEEITGLLTAPAFDDSDRNDFWISYIECVCLCIASLGTNASFNGFFPFPVLLRDSLSYDRGSGAIYSLISSDDFIAKHGSSEAYGLIINSLDNYVSIIEQINCYHQQVKIEREDILALMSFDND